MKRNDWILITAVLAVAVIFLGIQCLRPQQKDGMAVVSVDGEAFGSWPLSKDDTVEIGSGNRLVIEAGRADMVWADCPDQLCVHQKPISREGESLICLPNKVVVSIVGGEEREVDAVTARLPL